MLAKFSQSYKFTIMQKIFIKIGLGVFLITLFSSCGEGKKETDVSTTGETVDNKIDIEREIDKWKEELTSKNLLGEPCPGEISDPENRKAWAENNPDLLNGFPSDREKIGKAKADFDNDGLEDVFLYFNSENCTGHNGGNPSFAKIIYGNGNTETNVETTIISAIMDAYKDLNKTNLNLKEVTDNYLKENITIDYAKEKIQGDFRLYTQEDAHCCPSYTGKYTYNPSTKRAGIDLAEAAE